eukprot:GHVS01027210.1.p1 GENE.GHVS01027210.1~~GHVS01027210.1.p1  ORF type:complete len:781 (-),score=140.44 GHVS01027210.1:153-2495(-)
MSAMRLLALAYMLSSFSVIQGTSLCSLPLGRHRPVSARALQTLTESVEVSKTKSDTGIEEAQFSKKSSDTAKVKDFQVSKDSSSDTAKEEVFRVSKDSGSDTAKGEVLHVSKNSRSDTAKGEVLQVPTKSGTADEEEDAEPRKDATVGTEDSSSWVDSKLCLSLSVLFCLSAVLISACTIFGHSVHYNVPSQQRYVVRLLFFVPVYAVGSLLILMFINYFLYFEVLRDVWEAVVVYSFFSLILDYCGGENACAVEIARYPGSISHAFPLPLIGKRVCLLDVCRPIQHALTHPIPLNLTFVKNCKRCVLQFILLKPFMAIVSIIMYSIGLYHEWGFYWICLGFVYNASVCTALYGLFLFYMATRHHSQLVGRRPVGKFVAIKLVIIATWYQGFLLGLLPGFDIIHATKWNNFLLCIEMPLFAALNALAYPLSEFAPRNTPTVTTITMESSACEAPSVFGKHGDPPVVSEQGWPASPSAAGSCQTGWAVDGSWRTGLVVGDVVVGDVPTFGSRSVRPSAPKEEEVWVQLPEHNSVVATLASDDTTTKGGVDEERPIQVAQGCEASSSVPNGGFDDSGVEVAAVNVSSGSSLGGGGGEEGKRVVDSGANNTTAAVEPSERALELPGSSSELSVHSDGSKGRREGVTSHDGWREQDVALRMTNVVAPTTNGAKGGGETGRVDGECSESASSVVLKGGLMGRPMQILRNAIGDRQSHEKALKNVCDAVMMTDVVTDAYYNFNAKYHSHALLIDHSSEDEGGGSERDASEEQGVTSQGNEAEAKAS